MLKLKKYQEKTLDVLQHYLEQCRFAGAKQAYDTVQAERYNAVGADCIRPLDIENGTMQSAPTGGGVLC
jgi:hypothetical protein